MTTNEKEKMIMAEICAIPVEKWSYTQNISGREEKTTHTYKSKLGKHSVAVTIVGNVLTYNVGGVLISGVEKDFAHIVNLINEIGRNTEASDRELQMDNILKSLEEKPKPKQKKILFDGVDESEEK